MGGLPSVLRGENFFLFYVALWSLLVIAISFVLKLVFTEDNVVTESDRILGL